MLFNSLRFLIFFPIVTTAFFLTPGRWRWLLLLSASCCFYMAFVPKYILILAFIIVAGYAAGIAIEGAPEPRRTRLLWVGLAANIGMLFVFKYFNFFNENMGTLARLIHWNYPLGALNIILPIGLSFQTFRAMSYTLEVYYGRIEAERHLGIYALYVMFYPQLVAGPIERPNDLLPQFHSAQQVDWERIGRGLRLMLWGLFQKVVIADRLSVMADQVYNHPGAYTGLPIILATYAFAFQIYCDFSGYSDIAVGAGQVMGFRLMTNFDRPYSAQSIAEFWRRWHISLSSWFRDYLFQPLSFLTRDWGAWGVTYALAITFLITGLWHGANWTYVVWGGIHGACIALALWSAGARRAAVEALRLHRFPSLLRLLNVLITFHIVCFSWIFFRADSLHDAFAFIRCLAGASAAPLGAPAWRWVFHLGLTRWEALISFAALTVLISAQSVQGSVSWRQRWAAQPLWLRWLLYYAGIAAVIAFSSHARTTFVYAQF